MRRLVAVFLIGCSSSSTTSGLDSGGADTATVTDDARAGDTSGADAPTGGTVCEYRGLVCERLSGSGGCCAQSAFPYDEALACVNYAVAHVIGCGSQEMKGSCDEKPVMGCAITREGGAKKVWRMPTLAPNFSPSEPCDTALQAAVVAAPPCN